MGNKYFELHQANRRKYRAKFYGHSSIYSHTYICQSLMSYEQKKYLFSPK